MSNVDDNIDENDEELVVDELEDSIIDIDELFEESIKMLEEEIKTTDELYDSVKKHYDDVMKYDKEQNDLPFDMNTGGYRKRPRTQSFIHQQLSNLISLRTHKSSVIKDKFTIQKEKAALKLKMYQLQGKKEGDNSQVIINQLLMQIDKNNYELESKPNIVDEKITTVDIENRIKELESDVKTNTKPRNIEKYGILNGDEIVKYKVIETGEYEIIEYDVNISVDITEEGDVIMIETGDVIPDITDKIKK